jgi:hypothetical protein
MGSEQLDTIENGSPALFAVVVSGTACAQIDLYPLKFPELLIVGTVPVINGIESNQFTAFRHSGGADKLFVCLRRVRIG